MVHFTTSEILRVLLESSPNARCQPPLKAGATEERTLQTVSCTHLLGLSPRGFPSLFAYPGLSAVPPLDVAGPAPPSPF
jgi:hypothetical protein